MKNRILKKRINAWNKELKWKVNYIKSHHYRSTLIANKILFKYISFKPRPLDLIKELAIMFAYPNKKSEINRLHTLWNVKDKCHYQKK